ncbi:MAG: magnesium-translocating P-type ATPase [Thermoguttaceae bacterium]|jgi:Mg2+-importing ATPase
MPILPTSILPKNILAIIKRQANQVQVSPLLIEVAQNPANVVLGKLQTNENGLSEEEAQERLEKYGPNVIAQEQRLGRLKLLGHACMNPLVILLLILAVVSYLTGDAGAGTVMIIMVFLGVSLRFVQEARADDAAAKLKAMISVTATVVRGGAASEVPLGQLVPGDIIRLAAGDMIPADIRILSCKDLFVIQSSLTGESFPGEKFDAPETGPVKSLLELKNVCFLGTSVESGAATGVVVETGLKTYLGGMASSIIGQEVATSFDKGVGKFTWLMIYFMMVMVPLVFLVNGLTKHDWFGPEGAFFFALSVAVGMTPEMLPMIVTVCLSKGAIAMSRKKVIVKRLNAIQNLGAMDILCADKTGTLTLDRVILERHCDVVRKEDDEVLEFAFLNSHFQTGLRNVLDRAILEHTEVIETAALQTFRKVDEIPFDFSRKLMSVVVEPAGGAPRLISKGAPESVFQRCIQFELEGKLYPIDPLLIQDLKEEYDDLSADGFRVLAIAYKDLEHKPAYSKEDESNLVLKGYVAFLDPPKQTSAPAVLALRDHGVTVKILTGDNELVSRKICQEVGLSTEHVLLGSQVEVMSDAELAEAAENTLLFARLSPMDKQRIIKALQSKKHVVGFMGDGINDSPALRAADVGISVDTAVDIAKEAADVILLEKSLMIMEEGVLEGRKVYANILKYIRMGASSSFGNMFSVMGASAFLPFLPMKPMQILTNSLLYDFSQVPIPADEVDPEQIAKPRPWHMGEIAKFILFIGPCSSIFDYTTYFMMLYLFNCWNNASLFQTGWFVESLLTQTLIIHIIRTNRIPFIQSRASWPVITMSIIVMIVGMWLPFSPIGDWLGFTNDVPSLYWPLLVLTLACYVLLTQAVKMWLIRKGWI